MATTMKLPIIVICILSVILTIGIVYFEKTHGACEEMSTVEVLSEEYFSFEEVSTYEDFACESQPDIYQYDETGALTTKVADRVYAPVTTTKKAEEVVVEECVTVNYSYNSEREILAKLLYCESGSTSWDCQVYTCSAILNLSDYTGRSISNMASDKKTFSVAPWVWSAKPTQTQYDVIDYVLSGGRISDVKYFRTDFYHKFGTPVTNIDNVYFSK